MNPFRRHLLMAWIGCGLALLGIAYSGCTAVSLAGSTVSIGASAVRTTGSIGGAAIDVTGSTISAGLGGGDESNREKPEPEP